MHYKIIFFLAFTALFAEEIEVRLKTVADLKPIYLTRIHTDPSEFDWRYFEDLRSILVFDLNAGGFSSVLPIQDEWDQTLYLPNPKRNFDLSFWRREKIPYLIAIYAANHTLEVTVFNIEKGTSKKYPDCPITGTLEEDRKQIHKIADLLHKDLFGIEGIASLRLIYSRRTKNIEKPSAWISEIYISDYDGSNIKQATFENAYCITPSFNPNTEGLDNPSFFFVSFQQGQSKIYHSSLNSKKSELLFELRGNQVLPARNQKGTQIAFIADAAGRPDLFLQNFDPFGHPIGKARQLFSSPRATQASPTFSPDGKKIAFVSDKDGPPRIYAMSIPSFAETKRVYPRLLTKKNRENTSPSWSPDGKKLAYSSKSDGVRQIWIYNFETEEELALTSGPENKENPSWAPDSLHLVYNTETDEEGQIYLIDMRKKEPFQITKGSGQKRFPSWESR